MNTAALGGLCIVLAIGMRFVLQRENKRIAAMVSHGDLHMVQNPDDTALGAFKGDGQRAALYKRDFRYLY